jgi:arylsulfatase A-like enzyme
VADRENVRRQLESILSEGYEGVGWTIFKSGRQLDEHVRETLTRSLIEYINGPEAPTSGDELTFFITREVMREFAPHLLLVNFWDMDVAHWGSYSLYLQAITRTDRLTGMLWDSVQSDARYRDNTTLLILPELGRDGDANAANGFLNHRSGDASCRNMWMLAMGGGIRPGETERPIAHVDVAATAASLLDIPTGEIAGRPAREIL